MKISIIGLGWLGEPLAKYLIHQGHHVIGSTTSSDKSQRLLKEGIPNQILKLVPHPEGKQFNRLFDTETLILNVPPQRRHFPDTFHPEQVKYIKALAQQAGVKKIIYTSATSVYPNLNRSMKESEPLDISNTGNPTLLNAENLLWKDRDYDLTVIRLGGLLGMDRIPGRYFSGKENIPGHPPVNYIHQKDAVRLIAFILEKEIWNKTFNGVSPIHPTKKEIYLKNAHDLGIAPPKSFDAKNTAAWKEIDSNKIIDFGFRFIYENPLSFDYTP